MRFIIYHGFLISTLFAFSQAKFLEVTHSKGFRPYEAIKGYGSGISAADYNNDGFIDIFAPSDHQSPSRLYRNKGDGTFEAIEIGIPSTRDRAALWFDFNGDHLLDLLIAGDCEINVTSCLDFHNLKLLKQLPDGTFKDVTAKSGLVSGRLIQGLFGGMSAGDINNDGLLDLVINYRDENVNVLLNNADETFTNITEKTGLQGNTISKQKSEFRYYQPLLYDLSGDGNLDIYLTVDGNANLFLENNCNGSFSEIGSSASLDNSLNDMGITLGDYDNDEDLDIYITCIETATEHNVLLENISTNGKMQFNEISKNVGVNSGGWGWGTTFFDADNDGLLDLGATNESGDQSKLWRNIGNGNFEDVSTLVGFDDRLDGTALLAFDYDRDGDLDLAQSIKKSEGYEIGLRLLENQILKTDQTNFIVIKPRMRGSNHFAIGSLVKISIGNKTQIKPILAGTSFYGQEPAEAFFGIGNETNIDEVTVVWPGGQTSRHFNIPINQVVEISDENVIHAPAFIQTENVDSISVRITWKHMSTFETGFVVERSADETFETFESINIDSVIFEYIDTNLAKRTVYYYRVKAFSGDHTSAPSWKVKAETNVTTLTAPTDLMGIVLSEFETKLFWNDNSKNELGYVLQRSLDENFNSYFSYFLDANTSTFIDRNVEPKTTYYYRIRGENKDISSEFSNVYMLTTSVLSNSENAKIIIHPNPALGQFQIKLDEYLTGNISVMLHNIYGQLIQRWSFQNASEISKVAFIHEDSPGLYLITISQDDQKLDTQKIWIID